MLEHSDSTLIDGHSYLTLSEVCLRYGMSRKTLREKCNLSIFPAPCKINHKLWSAVVLLEYETKKKALCMKAFQRLLTAHGL